jgi:hypothetical protein
MAWRLWVEGFMTGGYFIRYTQDPHLGPTSYLTGAASAPPIEVSPDGTSLWGLRTSDGSAQYLDVQAGSVTPVAVAGTSGSGPVFGFDGASTVYFANGSDLLAVDISSRTVVATIPIGGVAEGIGASPDHSKIVLVWYDSGTPSHWVSVIDTVSNTVIGGPTMLTVTLPINGQFYVAVSPDNSTAYLIETVFATSSPGTTKLYKFSLSGYNVLATCSVPFAFSQALTADGANDVVGQEGTPPSVAIVATSSMTVSGNPTIPPITLTGGAVMTPNPVDNDRVYGYAGDPSYVFSVNVPGLSVASTAASLTTSGIVCTPDGYAVFTVGTETSPNGNYLEAWDSTSGGLSPIGTDSVGDAGFGTAESVGPSFSPGWIIGGASIGGSGPWFPGELP